MLIAICLFIVLVVAINYSLKELNEGLSMSEQKKIDKNNWNDGKCSNCGYEWTLYKHDPVLGRIYVCEKCDEITNVITNVDEDYE
jgi:hypothetical protein